MKPAKTQIVPYVCPPTELLGDETMSGVSLREHYDPDYSEEAAARIDELFKHMWRG